jgi:3-methylcrotonyl-CoA carboxylase alpha subunit
VSGSVVEGAPVRTGIFIVRVGDEEHRVSVGAGGAVHVNGGDLLRVAREAPGTYRVQDGTTARQVFVTGSGDRRQVFVDGEVYDLALGAELTGGRRGRRAYADLLAAPMPARVTAIPVEAGQAVSRGEVLVTLEAMKMELAVRAPRDGTVLRIACRVGELVQPGVALLEMA